MSTDTLRMVTTRPGNHPDILRRGWPALVRNLRVRRADSAVATQSAGDAGWIIPPNSGRVTVTYDVDYTMLAEAGWPAPREATYADSSGALIITRSLVVGAPDNGPIAVRFILPPGWTVAAPWQRNGDTFLAESFERFANNAIVLTRTAVPPETARGFDIQVAAFGAWQSRRERIQEIMRAHAATFIELMGSPGQQSYLSVFLEGTGLSGESYLDSYVMQSDTAHSVQRWGRIAGHELFHFWNGQRLRGADYTASQWFQEGVTEYVALLSMATNGFMDETAVLAQLSERFQAGTGMQASLASSGNRKNAAFYGSATVTAFLLDLLLRSSTADRHGLADLLRDLWTRYGQTDTPYTTAQLYDAASVLAGADLTGFFRGHVESLASPQTDALLASVGLLVVTGPDGQRTIASDAAPSASQQARRLAVLRPAGN